MKRYLLPAFLLLCSCILSAAEYAYTFFKDGKTSCRIVLSEKADAREKEAADLLVSSFKAMGKVTLPVVTQAEKSGINIHIGATEACKKALSKFPKVEHDGFLIFPASPNDLVLTGGSSLGALFGVMEFLERYAGMMWVWPGKYGTVTPQKKEFKAAVKVQQENPAFRIRQMGVDPSMAHFLRIAIRNTDDDRAQYSHNINKTMPPALWEKHPEYFNMLDGVRRKPVKMKRQACTSNPEVVKIFIEGAKRYFKRFPNRESFSVAQSDGGHFCECPQCRALDVPGVPGVTDRYFTFANQVAAGIQKDFPDKFIASLAYGDGTQDPPARISLNKNVIPCLVIPSMTDKIKSVEKWAKKANSLYAYFHLHGRENPKLHAEAFARYVRFLKKNHVVGICGELHPATPKLGGSYELDGPRSWLVGKLIWNPARDPQQLLKEFCARFYGAAAKPMERYYLQMEKAWARQKDIFDFRCDYDNPGFQFYAPEDMKIMVECVRQAEKLASDPDVKGRLNALKSRLFPRASYYCFIGMAQNPTPENVAKRIAEAKKLSPKIPMLYLPAKEAEAVDEAFKKLPANTMRAHLKKTPELDQFEHSAKKSVNICRNPGFEIKSKAKAQKPAGADWKKIDAFSWSSWQGVYTPGTVSISAEAARTGKRGILFEGCKAASVNYIIPVKPGERYKVTAWFKGKNGRISANFKDNAKKWLHKGTFCRSEVSAGKGDFEKIILTFTAPLKSTNCSLIFSVYDQEKGEKTFLDDVEIIKVK